MATAVWTVGDHYSLDQTWGSGVPWWNAVVRLAFFALVVLILAALKQALAEEQRLARVDALTQVANVRQFRERAEAEVVRASRTGRPFSVAVLDVDDLKAVNDRYGHAAGDALLVAVAQAWARTLRAGDLVARLGGDEFGVLLPETAGPAALLAVEKAREASLLVMAEAQWPSSLSVGVVTWLGGETDVEALLRYADALMYDVKSSGKDGVRGVELDERLGNAIRPEPSERDRIGIT